MGIALWVVQVLVAAASWCLGRRSCRNPRRTGQEHGVGGGLLQQTVRLIGALEVLGAIGIVCRH